MTVIVAIITIKSLSNDNSDRSYEWSYVLLYQAFSTLIWVGFLGVPFEVERRGVHYG